MKSMARAILFGGIIAATSVAVADKLSDAMGDKDKDMAATSMPGDAQPGDSLANAAEPSAPPTEGAGTAQAELQTGGAVTVTPSPSTEIIAAAPPAPESVTAPPVMAARPLPPTRAYVVTTNAFPSSVDDAGRYLVASRTHADMFASTMTASVGFPTSVDDAGRYLIASRTHADIFLDRPTRVAEVEQRGTNSGGN